MKTCNWKYVQHFLVYVPECTKGVNRIFKSIGAANAREYIFCPYCGGKIAPSMKEQDHG